ncbi:hypothetical protein SPRG_14810 [Saprolegnia parasitica CBS 223.65]|uniref:Nonsense-mediated mRNA decay factor SMG8 n=1 Tax=Saprolegnia parasitica (strain CBS 223.65) TaxID=695850 RepID=A0A067BL83_SAPPC|nr:hypothetical protein SPRG_14810 [Saprolegnia parasitica CBS 223.65]KDO18973.1 hypothetical protein SPRG_14810 [Saprolegnia parasitica CBS 223.65]|eukprot:XP_012210321.1 hypothetical protein SPRG_14810 [Saprolegnia parasitica CBS 223.65]
MDSYPNMAPPLPPRPVEMLRNAEVVLYPAPSLPPSSLLTALQQEGRPAVVVGVLGADPDATARFANRLLGRYVFTDTSDYDAQATKAHGIDVRFYYDHERHLAVMLGLYHYPHGQPRASVDVDRAKLHLLFFTSCHVLYMVKDEARVSTSQTRLYRTLSQAKHQLLQLLRAHAKQAHKTTHAPLSTSAYAPGRLVPILAYVFPLPPELAVRSNKGRAAMMTFCKAMEARVTATIKPLRNHVVGSVRLKDVPGQAAGKERRLFLLDPSHTVVAVARKVATSDCNLLDRMAAVLDLAEDASLPRKQLLQPLDDEDAIGVPHAIQYISKALDTFVHELDSYDDGVLALGAWLHHVQLLLQWIVVENALFASPHVDAAADDDAPKEAALSLYESLNITGTFAYDLCAREYGPAMKRYMAERPDACNSTVHAARVERTQADFTRCVGRTNPFASEFANKIRDACDGLWRSNGRRLCDAISIANQPCTVALRHDDEDDDHAHTSGMFLQVACHCGLSPHRMPDAFSASSNADPRWRLPCCRRHTLLHAASGASLMDMGDSHLYDPVEGFAGTMNGFVPKFSCLSPWYREASARRSKKAMKPATNEEQLVAYAGMEYECAMGHRFFFTTSAASLHDTVWPGCDMAVYVQCFQCALGSAKPIEHAQLRRVYVVSGLARVLSLHLTIKMDETEQVIFGFEYASLPSGRTLCCTLPYVFTAGDAGPLRHGANLKLHSQVLSLMLP